MIHATFNIPAPHNEPTDTPRLLRFFDLLQDHITRPENVVRWRWQPGDVAFWDNRSTQHRAVADFALQRRTLRRATVNGDVPVGIDGRPSRAIRKDRAVDYQPA